LTGGGGAGLVSSISGSAIQYAGGGSGGSDGRGPVIGIGLPTAGGGTGSYIASGVSASSNTGSGGGGGGYYSGALTGGAGGSGIVILRYPSYLAPATSTTGSPEMVVSGAWRVYTFVASGTITF
jgi:hypothetical protein